MASDDPLGAQPATSGTPLTTARDEARTAIRTSDALWPWALAAGIAAALVGWRAGEALYGRFVPVAIKPADWDSMNPYARSDVMNRQILATTPPAESKNAALAYGVLGAALGCALGVVGGLVRGARGAALLAGGVGLSAGLAAGAGASLLLGPVFYRYLEPTTGLMLPLLIHSGIWAAGGLALGLGLGDRRSVAGAALGGVVGAVVAAIFFELASATLFPTERLAAIVPGEPTSRLIAHGLVGILVALGAAYGVRPLRKRSVPAPRATA